MVEVATREKSSKLTDDFDVEAVSTKDFSRDRFMLLLPLQVDGPKLLFSIYQA